jgi:hypothetical protein
VGGGVMVVTCEWMLFGKNLRSFLAEAFRDIISNRPIPICSVILYYCGPDVKVSHHDFTYYGQHIGRDISLDAEGKRRINIVIFLYLIISKKKSWKVRENREEAMVAMYI